MERPGGVPAAAARALLLLFLLLARVAPGEGAPGTGMLSGPAVCRGGTQRPCYKIVYLHDAARRVGFTEALQACRRDGGDLVSIESQSEQHLIQKMIGTFSASDGDFWIGLTRQKDPDNSTECQNLYFWIDGSVSTFRNWYADEPSCGSEVCVVMYHQPSAPAGDGGPYMFQWNDDRCNIRNNFICKYSQEKLTIVPEMNTSPAGVVTESFTLTSLEGPIQEDITSKILKETKGDGNKQRSARRNTPPGGLLKGNRKAPVWRYITSLEASPKPISPAPDRTLRILLSASVVEKRLLMSSLETMTTWPSMLQRVVL
uniref:Layilin isoform X2 n=1 Tax=Pogona vitticeps TaxID=103695 RepID=A0ABM5EQH1_9SAUR